MSATVTAKQAQKRRWSLRPQFSLRVLLLAVTVFAIGFPIWYRWPIEEVTLEYRRIHMKLGTKTFQSEDKSAPPIRRTVTTWRRSWGKGKVKYGPKKDYYPDGEQLRVTNYENDQRHGPYLYTDKGELRESGQYVHDQKEGKWITSDKHMGLRGIANWHEDRLHGQAELHFPDGSIERAKFDCGLLTHVNDQPVSSPLLDRVRRGEITSPPAVEHLQREMGLAVNSSLGNWVSFATDMGADVSLLTAPSVSDLAVPFDARTLGLDTQSALALITHRNGLACDYRYSCLWITTPEDAEDWGDPTGVSDLRPKPRSPLAAAWNEPIQRWHFDEPLAKALDKMLRALGIPIDTDQIAPTSDDPDRFRVRVYLTINGYYLPLRDVVGLLLYKTRCRCRLDGDTLVILPPEESGR